MTKLPTRLTQAFAATLLVASGAAWKQDQNEELTKRVESLEGELTKVQSYLQAQAKASESYEKALQSVEDAGFTAGINPDSRTTLLSAMRADLKARRKAVPGASEEKAEEPSARRRRR